MADIKTTEAALTESILASEKKDSIIAEQDSAIIGLRAFNLDKSTKLMEEQKKVKEAISALEKLKAQATAALKTSADQAKVAIKVSELELHRKSALIVNLNLEMKSRENEIKWLKMFVLTGREEHEQGSKCPPEYTLLPLVTKHTRLVDRDEVKRLGGKYDWDKKVTGAFQWYAPKGVALRPLIEWI